MACRPPTEEKGKGPGEPQGLGATAVRLPFGGLASTDPTEVRAPLVRPFWLLAGLVFALAALWFLVLSLALSHTMWR
jgi:hypothetical protein